jgi:hypothetical protein
VKGAVRWLVFKAKESTLDLLGDLEILLQPPQSAGVEMRTAIQPVENITFLKCSQDLLYNAGFPNVIPVTLMFSSKNMPIPLTEVAVERSLGSADHAGIDIKLARLLTDSFPSSLHAVIGKRKKNARHLPVLI